MADHLQTVFYALLQIFFLPLKQDNLQLGIAVLQREIEMSGKRTFQVGDLAMDMDKAVVAVKERCYGAGEFGNGLDMKLHDYRIY